MIALGDAASDVASQCAANVAADQIGFDEPYPGIDCSVLLDTTPPTMPSIPLGVTGSPAPSAGFPAWGWVALAVVGIAALAGTRGERTWE